MLQKKPVKVWDISVNNIAITKLVKTKTNSKYLIRLKFDKVTIPLVLIMSTMSRYVQTSQV